MEAPHTFTSRGSPSAVRLPGMLKRSAPVRVGAARTPPRSRRRSKGLLELLESGAVGPEVDLEPLLAIGGPMRSQRVPLHNPAEKRQHRPQVMTENSGFKAVHDYKLDMEELARIPPSLNLKELKGWEAEQAKARRSQRSTVKAAAAPTVSARATSASGLSTSLAATAADPLHAARPAREDARTYTELLDWYSMHEFIIRKGKALRSTPEFASFKRHYASSWGEIEGLIEMLEKMLQSYGVELVYVDGRRLAQMASYQAPDLISPTEMLECINNAEEVIPLLMDASRPYRYGPTRHHVAATKIQATWRMSRQRLAYIHLLIGTRAAIAIQRQWAMFRSHFMTRRTIRSLHETRLTQWQQTMKEFKAAWPRIEESRRTIVHLPSLSYPMYQAKKMPFFEARQLGQLTRLSMLADPRVQLVFVVPVRPEAEIQEYYMSLLAENGVPNVAGRLTFVAPENTQRLPAGMSLTRLVLLSPRLLKLLAAMCTGKPAYIIPGVVGVEELTLATQLNIPLLSSEPRLVQAYGSKSGCRRLLEAADILTPPGVARLRSRADLLNALTSLILHHRNVQRWLIKLENEFGSQGHAYLDVNRLKSLQSGNSAPELVEGAPSAALSAAVLRELEAHAAKRIRLLHPSSYSNWEAYLDMFDSVGGCVQAVLGGPSSAITVNLFVAPSGAVRIESVVEPLLAPALTAMGSLFPYRSSVPYGAVRGASLSLGEAAYRKRIMGYLSVDFIVTSEADAAGDASSSPQPRLWGVDVDFGLTTQASVHALACVFSGSTWNEKAGTCVSRRTGKPLMYVYSGVLYNPYISSIRHSSFFSLCRHRKLTYDCTRQSGIVFHFLNVLLCNCLGVISAGAEEERVVQQIAEFQALLNMEFPAEGQHSADSNCVYFASLVRQLSQLLT
ncbi:hypothetical protein LSCM1_04301 [Leishmania martiniquensis]|uniref:IQCH-like ATP-grasp domain-containing protein n=1 Tax=Leishmania martiniquensis TaxID=1580590 RepID=A0A836KEW4_9TRYP|nr:hypothetical protein LSCM1_04301 [Leishmania martiniquensis]